MPTATAATSGVMNTPISIPDALLYSVLGFAIVFVCLFAIFLIVKIMSAVYLAVAGKKQADTKEAAAAAPAPAEAPTVKTATPPPNGRVGTYGELKLTDTDPRTAAAIMAIISDQTQIPLSELRFKSIRRIEK